MYYLQETREGVTDLAAIQRLDTGFFPYLLDSVANDTALGRYSLLFAAPQDMLSCQQPDEVPAFLDDLDKRWQAESAGKQSHELSLPFTGGWFVFLGYEVAAGIEPSLDCPSFPYEFPVAFASRCPAAIIVDHHLQQTHCVCETTHDDVMQRLLDAVKARPSETPSQYLSITPREADAVDYLDGVKRILEYIRAGDVFQVNLSRSWQVEIENDVDSSVIFNNLSQQNPAPFACLIRHQQGNIISSSPERLVRVRQGRVETRPIAGTRPRTHDTRDSRWLNELRTDHKEQAEHIMLIDLERNDLGRVCVPGTIEVDELMVLESYAHVHHIVSNIGGDLRPDVTPVDVLRAVFPGGTITGCPKVRCMEIIAELENEGRGPYTGSAGYINHDGSMDFNILIRTLFQKNRIMQFRAGAGIVADSVPERELEETRHKAKGLLLALDKQ